MSIIQQYAGKNGLPFSIKTEIIAVEKTQNICPPSHYFLVNRINDLNGEKKNPQEKRSHKNIFSKNTFTQKVGMMSSLYLALVSYLEVSIASA